MHRPVKLLADTRRAVQESEDIITVRRASIRSIEADLAKSRRAIERRTKTAASVQDSMNVRDVRDLHDRATEAIRKSQVTQRQFTELLIELEANEGT